MSEKKIQRYNSFLVLDFEATCDNKKFEPQEIIEFPCIKINATTGEVEDIFHHYVKPKVNPILTPFCTELTGIVQEMVENQHHFEETMVSFQKWLEKTKSFTSENKSLFVTCGDWDLKVMLPKQCLLSSIDIPPEMKHWNNIKKSFAISTNSYPREIIGMLSKLGLPHRGRLHSGIDDCYNIVEILKKLQKRGHVFEKTNLKIP